MRLFKLNTRDIDGYMIERHTIFFHLFVGLTRLFKNEVPKWNDGSTVLSDGNEFIGWDKSEFCTVPAHK